MVDGIALDGSEYDLVDEFLLQVENDHLLGTKCQGLLLDLGPVLLLANIGEETL